MLKKQNRLHKVSLDIHRKKCAESIERSKQNYFLNLGRKLANNRTGQISYWKIVNNLLNKCKIPRIPPLLISDKFVTSCKEKAILFNNFFVAQCQLIPNKSVLPNFHLLTTAKLDTLEISNEQILNILNNLVANKAHDPDEIFVNMIKLSGNTLCEPLKLIFRNIFETGIFPKQWERANVTSLKSKICSYSKIIVRFHYFPFLQKCSKKLFLLIYTITLLQQSHYQKAFDKVWHEGRIFKLRQNGVTISTVENKE